MRLRASRSLLLLLALLQLGASADLGVNPVGRGNVGRSVVARGDARGQTRIAAAALTAVDSPVPAVTSSGGARGWHGNGLARLEPDAVGTEVPPVATAARASLNSPPIANAGGPYHWTAGQQVQFDGTGSSDPDFDEIVSYTWTFGDGLSEGGAIVQHAYAAPGGYAATLTVIDKDGATSSDSTTVTIVAPTPASNVVWTSLVNATVAANSLLKSTSAAAAWDSGAVSQQLLSSSTGYVDFTITDQGARFVAGLGTGDTGPAPEDVEFGLLFDGLTVQAYETGAPTGPSFIAEPGDRFRVWVDAGVVRYAKNGRLLREASLLRQAGVADLEPEPDLAWRLAAVADVDGDGQRDLIWRHDALGLVRAWLMHGPTRMATLDLGIEPDTDWTIAGAGDFDRNGSDDLVWHHRVFGDVRVWLLDGSKPPMSRILGTEPDVDWAVAGAGDVDADRHVDVLWRHRRSGSMRVWLMNDDVQAGSADLPTEADPSWNVSGVGDFNGDGQPDLLWSNAAGETRASYMQGARPLARTTVLPAHSRRDWVVAAVGDLNGDGKADLLWRNTVSGANAVWYLDGALPYPLGADAALWSPGAAVVDAVLSGVPNIPPIADGGGSYLWSAEDPVLFNGNGSLDPDGSIVAYVWDFGDGTQGTGAQPSHAYNTPGTFAVTLTVTDNDGATATATGTARVQPAFPRQLVAWANPVGVQVFGNSIAKTGAAGWNAGASSHQALVSGDGYVEFLGGLASHRMAGLGTGDVSPHFNDIEFAVHLTDAGSLRVFESGTLVGTVGSYAQGDRLRAVVDQGSVYYVKNGRVLGTSENAPSYPLRLDASLFTAGAVLSGAITAGENLVVYNEPPSVTVSTSDCHVPCTATFTASASDPDGDPLTYEWSGCAAGQTGSTSTCLITAVGAVTATVLVTDNLGASASASAVAYGTNAPPTVTLSGPESCHPACTLAFVASGSDPEGDALTFTWGDCAAGQTGLTASCSFTTMNPGGATPVSAPIVSWAATTFVVLDGYFDGCNGAAAVGSTNCRTATERFCKAQPGYTGGFGPVEYDSTNAWVRCVGLEFGEEKATTWTTLSSHHSGCSGAAAANSAACNVASHRYCVASGFGAGFGPVEYNATTATPYCTSASVSRLRQPTFAQLQSYGPCSAGSPSSAACQSAANRYCSAVGYGAGYGAVEFTATTATVACLPSSQLRASTAVSVIADDGRGGTASAQSPIQLHNVRPDVSVSVSGSGCHVPCTATFTAVAADVEADPLTYTWSGCAAGQSGAVATCSMAQAGGIQATVVVQDSLGATATASGSAQGANASPSVSLSGDESCHPPCIAQFSATATDPDNDPLTLNWAGCAAGQTGSEATCALPTVPTNGGPPAQKPVAMLVTTTFAALAAVPPGFPGCWGPSAVGSGDCRVAANRYCGNQPQYAGGLAPVEFDATNASVVCFGDDLSDLVATTYTTLNQYYEACVAGAILSPGCKAAVNFFCIDNGYGAGVGPLEHADDDVMVVCTGKLVSRRFLVPFATLDEYYPGCANTANATTNCRIAINRYCRDRGHGGGFGPTAAGNGVAELYCLPREVGLGTADVSVVADDGRGGTASDSAIVQAINSWPEGVSVVANPTSCVVPCDVSFTASGVDPDGDTLAFSWEGCALGKAGTSVTCRAVQPGTLIASVNVSDGLGGTAYGSAQATAQPAGQNLAPVSKPGGPYRAVAGRPVTLDGRASYDNDGNITQAIWSFGDGFSAVGLVAVHTYGTPGTFTAWLGLTDDDGATHAAPATVVVVSEDDPDGDGLTNSQEQALGSNPNNPDTNGDGVPDGAAFALGLSLTDIDMDDDGWANAYELVVGTSPFNADTDGDGINDPQDAFPLDPTRWSGVPTPGDTTPPVITLAKPESATPVP